MDCPSCHAENAAAAVTCSACGARLRPDSASSNSTSTSKTARRSGSRRRVPPDESPAYGNDHDPSVRRAYHLSLWAFVPGAGLLLGPAAVVLGYLAARRVADDFRSLNRARAAMLFGALNMLTQWLGLYLMIRGWPP